MVENSKLEIEKIKTEAAGIKAELDAKLAEEKAKFVKARRDELGEVFSKDLTDEDICNDLKFENAKLKKELATVKDGKSPTTGGLEAGAQTDAKTDPKFVTQDKIRKEAFPEQNAKK